MNDYAALVPLPVVLPLLGTGAALMLSRFPLAQRTVSPRTSTPMNPPGV